MNAIQMNEFESYIKTISKDTYIYKAKVDKVNDDHTIDAKLYKGDTETDMILANVKVPFVIGLNDEEDDLECLIAMPEGDITNSYCICFFSKEHRLHITLDKTIMELKENKATFNIEDNLKFEASKDGINLAIGESGLKLEAKKDEFVVKTEQSTFSLGDKIEIGTTKTLKDLFDDVWSGIEAVNDNIKNLSDAITSGLQATGGISSTASLIYGHGAAFEGLNATTVATLEMKKANIENVLK